MKEGVYTITELLACLNTGGKIIGTKNGKAIVLNKLNVDCIKLLDTDNASNTVIVNDRDEVKLEFIIMGTVSVAKVNQVVKYNEQERNITVWMRVGDKNVLDELAIKYILLCSVICKLSLMKYKIRVRRYLETKEIKKDSLDFKIVLTSNQYDLDGSHEILNLIPIGLIGEELNTLEIVEILCSYLRANKVLNKKDIANVYDEYASGKIKSNALKLWSEAYNKFLKRDPENDLIYLPEILSRDTNTDVIVTYLAARYEQERYNFKKPENKIYDVDHIFEHPDLKSSKDAKGAVDDYLLCIIKRYIKGMTEKFVYSSSDLTLSLKVVIDYNGLIDPKMFFNMTQSGIYLISVSKENLKNSNIEIDIKVYVANTNMMNKFSSIGYLDTLLTRHKLRSYTVEYIEL